MTATSSSPTCVASATPNRRAYAVTHVLLGLVLFALLGPAVAQQGDDRFTNFETPQVKPIAFATLPRQDAPGQAIDVVFVCNAPDNTVEVYDAGSMVFLGRVVVGQGPATVRWFPLSSAPFGLLYACCIDGDCVSLVTAEATGPGQVELRLHRTVQVGDQPADIALAPAFDLVAVTLSGRSSVAYLNPLTLQPVIAGQPETLLELPDTVTHPQTSEVLPVAVKAPRQIEIGPDNRVFVLNHRGDTPGLLPAGQLGGHFRDYDLDLWWADPANGQMGQVKQLGSTNHAFARTSDGEMMVVVGTSGRNVDQFGETNVKLMTLGFVESWMWVVDTPANGGPAAGPRAQAAAVTTPTPVLPSLNLNRDYTASTLSAVAPGSALAQPTDVAIKETAAGDIDVIAITAFHSDRVALLTPDTNTAGGYQVAIVNLTPAAGYSVAGPRGITFHPATNRFYVACRLDNTIRVIDSVTATELSMTPMFNDPTPSVIRDGRKFLYSAKLSASGIVSCASCHIDGRTDGLAWDIGVDVQGQLVPTGLPGGGAVEPGVFTNFPAHKGFLVTQTLQGLVNDVVNEGAQVLFSNAPYHWRGDRANFQAFRPAFQDLLNGPEVTVPEMNAFTAFINTIRHTPNPEQDRERRVPGTISGSGATLSVTGVKAGVAAFHNALSLPPVSCVDCHALPEGSDNLLTDNFRNLAGSGFNLQHPFETAQLRGVADRDARVRRGTGEWATANEGILHSGSDIPIETIDLFVGNPGFALSAAERPETIKYVRQFDTGTAPAATYAYTLDPSPSMAQQNIDEFVFLEDQVGEANCGLVVLERSGTSYTGYWYDITGTTPVYRQEGTANTKTRTDFLNAVGTADTTIVLQGTPSGSVRRHASANGVTTAHPAGPAPSNIVAMPMAPMTYHTDIPRFNGLLHVDLTTNTVTNDISTNTSVWALRTFQLSVLGQFGVNAAHIPPRRMRCIGSGLREGAKLCFLYPHEIEFDLYPTKYFTTGGDRIWETEEEMDPMMQMFFLNGGPPAPDTWQVLYRQTTNPQLNPTGWNFYRWIAKNDDGSMSPATPFTRLTVQDAR